MTESNRGAKMIEKLNIFQFNEYKEKLNNMYETAAKYYEEHEKDSDFDLEKYEEDFFKKYTILQNELLSFDLSEIPFESWADLEIYANDDYIPDFSRTKANIDFNILDFYNQCNFKNCTIKNLEVLSKLSWALNEESFDEKTIVAYPELFLSNIFDSSFKNKYYKNRLIFEDLIFLNEEQINELENKIANKDLRFNLKDNSYNPEILKLLGLKKIIDLYKYSKEDLRVVLDLLIIFRYSSNFSSENTNNFEKLLSKLKIIDCQEMKASCYEYERKNILEKDYRQISVEDYPKKFIEENEDIFLINANISEEIKKKYYNHHLSIYDVIENFEIFSHLPIEKFLERSDVKWFAIELGTGSLQYVLKNHKKLFTHLLENNQIYIIERLIEKKDTIENSFLATMKKYFSEYYNFDESNKYYIENNLVKYKLPDWADTLNFEVIESFKKIDELKFYNKNTLVLDESQRSVLETFSTDNIIKFDNETGFFSHFTELGNFKLLGSLLNNLLFKTNVQIPDKNLTYSEFKDIIAFCLDYIRKNNEFYGYPNYDYITGDFRKEYPDIFIDQNAPGKLKNAFYKNKITLDFLKGHKEYIPYLKDRNITNIFSNIFNSYIIKIKNNNKIVNMMSFYEYYMTMYGNENFLNLIADYGDIFPKNVPNEVFDLSYSKEETDKKYREIVYQYITKSKNQIVLYNHLINQKDFIQEYPDIFLFPNELEKFDELTRKKISSSFYGYDLDYELIRKNPELVDILKNKNIKQLFTVYNNLRSEAPRLIEIFGTEHFLKLCAKYGSFLNDTFAELPLIKKDNKYYEKNTNIISELNYDRLCELIESIIARQCFQGKKFYFPDNAPEFLKQQMPNLFLDSNAPKELQSYFYCENKGLNFTLLSQNREWLDYLKGKSVITAFKKNTSVYHYDEISKYFEYFGEEKGLKLGIQRTETVEYMIQNHKISLMKRWYDKTGQKFIPDRIIMENFPLEEADKFLVSGSNWSRLMKIKDFAETLESRDAMLKLAYCFGVFDQDLVGMKKLQELLSGIPRHYSKEEINKLKLLEKRIIQYNYEIIHNPDEDPTMPFGVIEYGLLKEELKKLDFNFTSEYIFSDLFSINPDNSATLQLNIQNYMKIMSGGGYLRKFLEIENIVINRDEAHRLFSGFSLKYDKDFREFLLKNLKEIRNKPEHTKYVSMVQRQFDSIKAINSNRKLTWDLAVSFVQSNKYIDVNIGNERVAEISAIAGYSQSDFNTLQQIYNYGKIRTFNSIPRIEKSTSKYSYEILRLDDPLAMAIGTLTDCCQEIGNVAELCMEHSMVDKNGRIFIIRDNKQNIVAQSWIWRNKDVLCFDNIEIPDKAFDRAIRENPDLGRKGFTEEIYNIYKQAAQDLIEYDELVYKDLLEKNKITKEQYDGLRLGKITVGLGYNDIADSIHQNSDRDNGMISRPLSFEEPVKLQRGLYTNDSNTQYILEERKDRKEYHGATLAIHSDLVTQYTDETFDEKMLLTLEKLEYITKSNQHYLKTQIDDNNQNIVSSIAYNYDLNPETTRIIMNPNFAIIYDINNNKINIGDLFYNFYIDNGEQQLDITNNVLLQIKLALNQIAENKKIDISKLNEEQIEIYKKLESLDEAIDIEKGVSHGK